MTMTITYTVGCLKCQNNSEVLKQITPDQIQSIPNWRLMCEMHKGHLYFSPSLDAMSLLSNMPSPVSCGNCGNSGGIESGIYVLSAKYEGIEYSFSQELTNGIIQIEGKMIEGTTSNEMSASSNDFSRMDYLNAAVSSIRRLDRMVQEGDRFENKASGSFIFRTELSDSRPYVKTWGSVEGMSHRDVRDELLVLHQHLSEQNAA